MQAAVVGVMPFSIPTGIIYPSSMIMTMYIIWREQKECQPRRKVSRDTDAIAAVVLYLIKIKKKINKSFLRTFCIWCYNTR